MKVVFVNSVEPSCGVHQFGLNLWRIIKESKEIEFTYCAPASHAELMNVIHEARPEVVLFNFYPATMPWVTLQTLVAVRANGASPISIYHEVRITGFDALIYPDPTFVPHSKNLTTWFRIGRPLPEEGIPLAEPRKTPLISTSGFGFGWKGHERLTRLVVEQFQKAKLRLHLPFAKFGDADGSQARGVAERCRAIAAGTNIELEIDHGFMEAGDFVDWLSESDLVAYLYDEADTSRGIASTTDHALAARVPIALTKTRMFRHLHSCKGIFIEENTLPEIMALGTAPLEQAYRDFSEASILRQVEDIFRRLPRHSLCRLLRNDDRAKSKLMIEKMREIAPEMMSRKIPEANVQQAWTAQTVMAANPKSALCVGCFEDTGFEFLKAHNASVVGIDPALNGDLRSFVKTTGVQFPCVFSTSVIEHVENDEQFIRDLCDSLESDGVCILTTDFKDGWRKGQPLPATDIRFYTRADIERIRKILTEKNCYFINEPRIEGGNDFHYQGHDYSFLALVFKKL